MADTDEEIKQADIRYRNQARGGYTRLLRPTQDKEIKQRLKEQSGSRAYRTCGERELCKGDKSLARERLWQRDNGLNAGALHARP